MLSLLDHYFIGDTLTLRYRCYHVLLICNNCRGDTLTPSIAVILFYLFLSDLYLRAGLIPVLSLGYLALPSYEMTSYPVFG